MITLRPYQQSSIDETFGYWKTEGGNPLIVLATGLGKSLVVADLCREILDRFPTMRIMMLVHVRELVAQNFQELLNIWPTAPAGVYSAGLNSRDTHHRITYASIQSVYKKAEIFAPRDLIIIDEAHLVPSSGEGMYQTFFEGLREHGSDFRVCGLTATDYRMGEGRLTSGDNPLFDKVVHDYGVGPGTEDGWLCPLTGKAGKVEIDVGGVKKRGGEFIASDLNRAALKADIIGQTVDDLMSRAADRKSWLVFCSGVEHADAVAEAMRERGISAATVTGNTPKQERDQIIDDFKCGRIRALTNANVLTTGFNAPNTDLIALLRPTLSTGLYVQMMGRGTRVLKSVDLQACANAEERVAAIQASAKPNCLVLDYAGNIRRHGPVDMIDVREKEKRDRSDSDDVRVDVDEVNAKECPECETLVYKNARTCPECGFEFGEPKHETTPDEDVVVMSRELEERWIPVTSWSVGEHYKGGNPNATPTLRVDTVAGTVVYSDWLGFEHTGYANRIAVNFWYDHGGQSPSPDTVEEALTRFDELTMPTEVQTGYEGKYLRIKRRRWSEDPATQKAERKASNVASISFGSFSDEIPF